MLEEKQFVQEQGAVNVSRMICVLVASASIAKRRVNACSNKFIPEKNVQCDYHTKLGTKN